MSARRWLLVLVASLAALLVAGRFLAGVYADWTWYEAMGALPLYQSALVHGAALRMGALLVGFTLAFLNLFAVRRSIVSLVLPRQLGNIEIGEAVSPRTLLMVVIVASLGLALLLALPQDDWTILALARFGQRFGEYDPFSERDFGDFLYALPLERSLYEWALFSVVAVTMLVVLLYAITPSLRVSHGRIFVSTYVRRHLSVLAALLMALIGWSYRIELLTLMSNGSATHGAFGAYDHRVLSPLLTTMSVLAGAASLILLWAGWKGHRTVSLVIVSVLILGGPVARVVLPFAWTWRFTEAQRAAKDRPYHTTQALYTRRAFALDDIVQADSAGVPLPSRQQLAAGLSTWDPVVLARAAAFERRADSAVAIAWRPSTNGLQANVVQRPVGESGNWALLPIEASHVDVRGRALRAGDEAESAPGLTPVLVASGTSRARVLVDSLSRLAAPPFVSWTQRIAHAWHLQNPRLLFFDASDSRTRIVFRNELRVRVAAIAPFFTMGPTVQAVVSGDSLFWVAELFVTSTEYPLADTIRFADAPQRYVRHAATALVQAYSGRVTLVADPQPEPVTRSWMQRFPWLFVSRESLPRELVQQWPPSVDWGAVQSGAIILAGFARDSTRAVTVAASNQQFIEPSGAFPALYSQGGDRGPLAHSTALVDADDRITGVLVSRGGDLPRAEWYAPPPNPIAGAPKPAKWRDVLDQLASRAAAAGFGRARASDKRGAVQVIPSRDGFAFVQSFYDWPADGPPSLTGVSLLLGSQLTTGPMLSVALGLPAASVAPVVPGTAVSHAQIARLYDEMASAMRSGDWVAFGRAYSALGRLLGRPAR